MLATQTFACSEQRQTESANLTIKHSIEANVGEKPNGEVLYSKITSLAELTSASLTSYCEAEDSTLAITKTIASSGDGGDTYATSIPGLGIRLAVFSKSSVLENINNNQSPVQHIALKGNSSLRPEDILVKVSLVKTGDIRYTTENSWFKQGIVNFSVGDNNLSLNLDLLADLPEPVCYFSSQTLFYQMPTISLEQVKNNSLPGPSSPLDIDLRCNSEPHLISMTLNGYADANVPGALLSENGENSALGVGVQLLYKSNVLLPGIATQIIDNYNNGYNIQLFPRYAKTADTPKAGTINIVATITMNYL